MKNLYSLLAFVGLFFISSCTNDDTILNQQTQNPVDLYVVGIKNGEACYWKNNQFMSLDQGSFDSTFPSKILVSNNTVHVLGNSNNTALYWNNGSLTNLTTTLSDNAQVLKGITDMEVVGNDVYLVGYTKNPIIAAEIYDLAYWKNGQKTILAQNLNYVPQALISVVNNDVYVSSQSNLSDAKYYKNGVATNLAVGTHVNGLTKKNNSVYLYGNIGTTGFYKNLETNVETTFPSTFSIENLVFDGNDVYYIAAEEIYKNSVVMPFNVEPVNGEPNALVNFQKIIVLNQNVYSVQNFSTLTTGFSIVGINNTNVFESNATNEAGNFSDLFVVQN